MRNCMGIRVLVMLQLLGNMIMILSHLQQVSGERVRVEREALQALSSQFASSQLSKDSLQFDQAFEGFLAANEALQAQDNLEQSLSSKNLVLEASDSPEFHHSQFQRTKPEAIAASRVALTQEFASNSIVASSGLEDSTINSLQNTIVSSISKCPVPPKCTPQDDLYRSYDGSCNNKKNPLWGKTFTPFIRMKEPPNYDGLSEPRKSVTGAPLHSAREISNKIAKDMSSASLKFTLSVMQWGQFIDHDLTHSPIAVISDPYGTSGILCCTTSGQFLSISERHGQCFPIEIPIDDPFYSKFGKRCMNFVRSMPAPQNDCTLGHRNQMNQLSHYLDGSQIYGSSEAEAARLRSFINGLLKTNTHGDLLPIDSDAALFGFLAGDSRVNEQPHLSIIHTLWMRQHNRVARILKGRHPDWKDEKLYQEARRIIGAQIQHIVYNEWLPIILGSETMEDWGLVPEKSGTINSYNEYLDASIANEFAAVGFRFGHTLIQGDLFLFSEHDKAGYVKLEDSFDNPGFVFSQTTFDQLLRGLFQQPIQNFDSCVEDDLTNKLFKTSQPFGLDLVALNIQRGRDHGIGTYNQLRSVCGLSGAVAFGFLKQYLESKGIPNIVEVFQDVYDHVEDIDAFIAGISEKPYKGGILGPLFNCIIRNQFLRLKYGDRFYYENGGLPSSFTTSQLDEIRKTTWARIICDNSKTITEIQPQAFLLPDDQNNKKGPCSNFANIPNVNFNVF